MNVRTLLTRLGGLLGAAALVSLAACAEKPTEHPFTAAAPKVTITGIQISGGVTRVFANGTDEDGLVKFYRFTLDNNPVVDSVTTSVYDFNVAYGSMDEQHTVKVTCVDDQGNESLPAKLEYTPNKVGTLNRTPDTEIFSPIPGAITSEGVVVVWNGRDPDGSVTGYQVRFDEDAAWTNVSGTSYKKTGLTPGGHVVQVRALDNFNVADPTPATAAFTVKAGLKPELNTTGVSDGSTFFVPPGGTVDIPIGWDAAADFYYGDVEGYAYDFDSTGITSYSPATAHTFSALGQGKYTVTVYAKDIGGNVAAKTIGFSIVVPSLSEELLAVNGVHWGTYGPDGAKQLDNTYPEFFKADDPANNPWQYWDIFSVSPSTYTALGMDVNLVGTGTPGGDVIGKYKCILWLGQNYLGDLDSWNPDLIAGYIKAGGKLLFAGRRTASFFNDNLMSMAHITGFLPDAGGSFCTGLKTTAAGAALGLQDVTYLTPSWGNGITGTDGSSDVEVLGVDPADATQITAVRAKSVPGGDWDIVVLTGRQYRADPPAVQAENYRLLLKNTLGVTPPKLP